MAETAKSIAAPHLNAGVNGTTWADGSCVLSMTANSNVNLNATNASSAAMSGINGNGNGLILASSGSVSVMDFNKTAPGAIQESKLGPIVAAPHPQLAANAKVSPRDANNLNKSSKNISPSSRAKSGAPMANFAQPTVSRRGMQGKTLEESQGL